MTEQERIAELANEMSEKLFTPDWEDSPERTVQAMLVIAIMLTTETWRKIQPKITEDQANAIAGYLHSFFNATLSESARMAGVPTEVVTMDDQVKE